MSRKSRFSKLVEMFPAPPVTADMYYLYPTGSIITEMTMESNQKNTLDSSAQQVANDVKSGSFSLDVDGESMTADKTVWVDGQAQNSSDTTPTTTKVN